MTPRIRTALRAAGRAVLAAVAVSTLGLTVYLLLLDAARLGGA